MKAVLRSVVACPECGFTAKEEMPTDACIFFYECKGCHKMLKPLAGDCCVFCSFGSVKCPSVQIERGGNIVVVRPRSSRTHRHGVVRPRRVESRHGDGEDIVVQDVTPIFTIKRNCRSRSNGIVGHVRPEIAVTMVRNTQIAIRRLLDLTIPSMIPVRRVTHRACTYHVQIDVDKTAMQVRIGFDGGGVVAVFSKGAQARFPAVVVLRRSSRSELYAPGNDAFLRVLDQQMNVIGRHHIVEDAQPEALACFVEPVQVAVSVPRELEGKDPLVAPMGEMPDMTRQEVTIGTRQCADLLKLSFCHQKGGPKRPAERYFKDLSVSINGLWWSDPDLSRQTIESLADKSSLTPSTHLLCDAPIE